MAVHAAHAVMQQNVSGAGRARAAVGSDDAVGGERHFDFFAFKPVVQEIRGALREDFHQADDLGARQAAQRPISFRYSMKSPMPCGGKSGGVVSSSDSATIAEFFQMRFVARIRFGIVLRELGDLGQRLRAILPHEQVAPIGEGREERGVLGVDAIAEAFQLQIAHDFFLHQAREIGRRRNAVAGPDFFGDGAAAHQFAGFEN